MGTIFADGYSNGSATFRVAITSRYLFLHFSSVWIYDRCLQAADYGREEFLHICTVYLFFPQIAAGPIGRGKELLPQFKVKHYLNREDITTGLRWMLWGYFMKVVVADRLALYTDAVFGNIAHHTGGSILVAAVLFTFQIYCDFAGYSFIALGCARIMGFRLIVNFARPYMATSVQDFWRRWHISLSTWFRDYLYIPLGVAVAASGVQG